MFSGSYHNNYDLLRFLQKQDVGEIFHTHNVNSPMYDYVNNIKHHQLSIKKAMCVHNTPQPVSSRLLLARVDITMNIRHTNAMHHKTMETQTHTHKTILITAWLLRAGNSYIQDTCQHTHTHRTAWTNNIPMWLIAHNRLPREGTK